MVFLSRLRRQRRLPQQRRNWHQHRRQRPRQYASRRAGQTGQMARQDSIAAVLRALRVFMVAGHGGTVVNEQLLHRTLFCFSAEARPFRANFSLSQRLQYTKHLGNDDQTENRLNHERFRKHEFRCRAPTSPALSSVNVRSRRFRPAPRTTRRFGMEPAFFKNKISIRSIKDSTSASFISLICLGPCRLCFHK